MAEKKVTRTPRKRIYIGVIIVAVLALIIFEAVVPGTTDNLSGAAEIVVDRLGAIIPTAAAVIGSVLALLNLTDDEPKDLYDPVEDDVQY
ncbi:hypothetical protein [Nesterenkonia haasae]|uniref:hypothetical protein n=1 Tax=Nesterenkonia haasae TaxID=2587813 RepID=UPI001391D3E9|nr:hypothetical protein [Nesterenkonia haasae]NDK31169.1 hypothetical protein [Nesterenkonia haasae]